MSLLVEMGFTRDQKMFAAFIPSDGEMLEEQLYREGKEEYTAFSRDGVLLDLFPLSSGTNVKFWKIRKAAQELKLRPIEPTWHGPAEEFSLVGTFPRHYKDQRNPLLDKGISFN